jgi:hypothetical protein
MARLIAGPASGRDVATAIAATFATGNEMFRRAEQPHTLFHRHPIAFAKTRKRLRPTVPHFAVTVATAMMLANGGLVSPPFD